MVPVLDHEQPAGTQPRKERFERSTRLVEAVRGVVDDEAQRPVAELVVKDRRQSVAVRLVDAVVQPTRSPRPRSAINSSRASTRSGLRSRATSFRGGATSAVRAALPPKAIPSSTKFSPWKRSTISRYASIPPGSFSIENNRPLESSNPQRNSTSPTRKCGVVPVTDER